MIPETISQKANTCKRCGTISFNYINCPHCGLRYQPSGIVDREALDFYEELRIMTDEELDEQIKLQAESVMLNYKNQEPLHEIPGGSCPSQYGLPENCKELQDLIEYREMNFALGNIFKAVYRMGSCSHSDKVRDLNKIIWFANRELERIK